LKIAILGAGGAGLSCAWLLDECHEVTVFERDDRVGGHAQTVAVAQGGAEIPVSAGFHFFSRRMYPRFVALLEHLGLPLVEYEQTCTFVDRGSGRVLCLPPAGGLARYRTLLGKGAISAMLNLRKVLAAAEPLVAGGDWSTTFGDFVARLDLPRTFTDELLLPFFASNWGLRTDEISALSARAVLSYATMHQPTGMTPCMWTEIDGGIERYAEALARAANRTRVLRNRDVTAVSREATGYLVHGSSGTDGPFEHVVFATSARRAERALAALADSEPLREILRSFEYFETRISVHRDPSFLAADRRSWSIVNLTREAGFCAIHHWVGWRHQADVFRSWVTHYDVPPRDVIADVVYEHGKPTPAYYAAQTRLAAAQGRDNLWFAGVYTRGFDNHESAVESAIEVARSIGAGPRMRVFEAG
jgi:predicted NAD/FAD-binding protein